MDESINQDNRKRIDVDEEEIENYKIIIID